MPTDLQDRLQRSAPTGLAPLDVNRLWRRAQARRTRRRAATGACAGTVVAVIAAFSIHEAVAGHGARGSQVVTTSPLPPGSPGMPATFVAADFDNEVDLVDSGTGRIDKVLLRASDHPIDGIATTPTEVYLATYGTDDSQIVRISRSGGTPAVVASVNAFDLALSPNGTELAWVNATAPPAGQTSLNLGPTVSVDDLRDGNVTTWTLDLASTGRDSDVAAALAWATGTQLEVLDTSTLGGTVCSTESPGRSSTGPPSSCSTASPASPELTTIDTALPPGSTVLPTVALDVPPVTLVPGNGAALPFLSAGAQPGTILMASRQADDEPATIYQLTLTGGGTGATVRPETTLAGTEAPASLDADHDDLLITELDPTDQDQTGYIARSTDGASPVILNSSRPWASASW